jgi:serine/threonine protein kinase
MKSIEIESSNIFVDEVNLLKKLNKHENILNYIEDFIYSGYHCIITEYCEVSSDLEIFFFLNIRYE